MPSDKPESDLIADSQFAAHINDPQADWIVFGFDQLQQFRHSFLCAYAANGVLSFGKPLCFIQRSVPVLLQPTRQRPPVITWFAEADDQNQNAERCRNNCTKNEARFHGWA